jgi:CMP-N-acetylneuraminic acid synthetase
MIFGAIPVKAISTRFPGKNFQILRGEYLINYAIRRLRPHVERIIISTDAVAQVTSIVGECKVELPEGFVEVIGRSAEVLDGNLPSNEPVRDAFRKMDLTWGHKDLIVMTQVTSPLIRSQTVARCIAEMQNGSFSADDPKTDLAITVNPDLKPNGGLYVCRAAHFMTGPLYRGRIHLHTIPFKEGIDIDYPHQLPVAEAILRGDIS